MVSRIMGITVEIGGYTTKLEQSLKAVNCTIRTTQSQLKSISRLLKLNPTNTELLTQKQAALKEAISATKEKQAGSPEDRTHTVAGQAADGERDAWQG